MNMSRKWMVGLMVACLALAMGVFIPSLVEKASYAKERGEVKAAREQLKIAVDLSMAYKEVAKVVRPSVVSVTTTRKVVSRQDHPKGGPWYRDPFQDFFFHNFGDRFPRQEQQRGFGTGVIISEDGYILTNSHVVFGDQDVEVTVKLSDDSEYDAKVVGADAKSDVAVLKIDKKGLVAAELGDSDEIDVGEIVLAMGNPLGFQETVTAGIVSAKGRSNVGVAEYEDFIQTDAAINPGNSGGPLINLHGEVIGINTAIATRSGGFQGIGFAIPINMARSIKDSIIEKGGVIRGYLGVYIQDMNQDMADSFGFDSKEGVLVNDVLENSPAESAGIQPGDIIIRYDGKKMKDASHLKHTVAQTEPNKSVEMLIYRDGRQETLAVTIGEQESGLEQAGLQSAKQDSDIGWRLQNLSPDLLSRFGLDADQHGVLVADVEPGSPAEKSGLMRGDIILSVNGQKVNNARELKQRMHRVNLKKGARLHVLTQGVRRFVILKVK